VVYVEDRDRVRTELEKRGIETAVHYPVPVHLQEAFAHLGYKKGDLPNTERACERVISMPVYAELTEEQVRYAASSLAEIVAQKPNKAAKVRVS
jgi:dTDP-4-amino-4,6-dideoxygalactose transaminase